MTTSARAHPRAADTPLRLVRVGAVTIVPLLQFHYRVPPLRFFPDLDREQLDPSAWYWQPPYCEDGLLVVDIAAFLIRSGRRTILVDAAVGNGKPRPNPCFDRRDDDWLTTLGRAGARPEDVDTVVFTHLHVDHVGFATHVDGPTWKPTFPRARHLTTTVELEYWTGQAAGGQRTRLGDYVGDSVLPLHEAGVLDVVPPDSEIDDHVRLVPAPGHTPGNVCVEVGAGDRHAVFTGDMVHHALQLAYPSLSTDFCVDGGRATEAREALLHTVADTDTVLFPAHFPDAAPGRVVTDPAGGYRYDVVEGEPL